MTMMRRIQDGCIAALGNSPLKPLLQIKSGGCGFFGDVFLALNGIRFAERHGMAARVCWGSRSLYHDVEREPNAWDYYFRSNAFDFSGTGDRRFGALPYRPGADTFEPYDGMTVRASVNQAIGNWCRPRGDVTAVVDEFVERHFQDGATLGVHVRLTDAAAGHEDRKTVGLEHFVDATSDWLGRNPGGRVFLAADDERVVSRFSEVFAGRVIAQSCLRSTDGTSLHGHYDGGVVGRPYRKGFEVLVDALLLARCNHLIRTHSRVTCYSLCVAPSLTWTDLDVVQFGVDRTPWLRDERVARIEPAQR